MNNDWLGDLMRSRYRARTENADADEHQAEAQHVDLDAAARSERPAEPINMNDVVRSVVLSGRPEDWQRERERHE